MEESEYRIQEGGPGETHVALRVCLMQSLEGAQSVELEGGRDSLSVSVTLNTLYGTATGRYGLVHACKWWLQSETQG